MRISSPHKKKWAFGLVGLLLLAALGNVLWFFQDAWLPYWFPEKDAPVAPMTVPAAGEPTADPSATTATETPASIALEPELDFLSAAAWDNPQFLQGVRLFNRALDLHHLFLRDRSQSLLPAQVEEGALQAAKIFEALRTAAPPAVPLGDYLARCQRLVVEVRRLSRPTSAIAAATPSSPPSPAPRTDFPPHRPGEPWQHPDFLQGARLFNQALEQYQLFLANKSRTALLKPIEDDAFQAAKKFESLKSQAPDDVALSDHITQCYKLISDCRRLNLEGAHSEPDSPFDRSTAGPNRRPALPAYQPPP